MKIAEDIFQQTVIKMLIDEIAVPLVKIEDAKSKFRVQLKVKSDEAKVASARERYSVYTSDAENVMQQLFGLEKFNCFRDLTMDVAKEAMTEALIDKYIEEELIPKVAADVIKQEVAVECFDEQMQEKKDGMFDSYLEHILHEVLADQLIFVAQKYSDE